MQFTAGENVTVRGARWVVDEMTAFGDCAMLCLSAVDPLREPRTCKLLLPFDRPARVTRRPRRRVVEPRTWMRHLLASASELRSFGRLRAGARAAIEILPFQLEPALALITGQASRFLLADEVGLGKTIQAGLMLAELQERGWCEHALILTPAGLRHQWADELEQRFQIPAAVIDAAALSGLTRSLPTDVNPWTVEPVVISSIDFVKQPEILRALRRQVWDILIVDEAHQASAASLRYDAAQTLAARSRHVVLLTATPHHGDDAAYRALCGLGRVGEADPLILFRRTRRQAGLDRTRRVHLLPVRLTAAEMEMHRLLLAYVARLWHIAQAGGRRDVQLVAMVLSKRAFSSASSFAASVERRLAAISGSPPRHSQAMLSFELDTDSSDEPPEPAAPALDNTTDETELLSQLLHAARAAQADERKMRVLRRLMRRVREPLVVFTEYRDTLDVLESAVRGLRRLATLHGGKNAQERRSAVEAFTSGAADLLLATDAGAEGLNLHARCRLVVNLELPWNPIRLEQRIGRVDRIGQPRTVHAINLFAQETAESAVLAGLLKRLDRIHASEIEIAASIISRAELPIKPEIGGREGCTQTSDLEASAASEATRIRAARANAQTIFRVDEALIPVTFIRAAITKSPLLRSLHHHCIWIVRVRITNGAGRLVEEPVVPVATSVLRAFRRRDVRRIAEHALIDGAGYIVKFVSEVAQLRARQLEREWADWTRRALTREAHLQQAAASGEPLLVQPGLFDNRALRLRDLAEQDRHRAAHASAVRSTLLEASATAAIAQEPQIAMLLLIE